MKSKLEDGLRDLYEGIKRDPGHFVEKWTKKLTSDGIVYKKTKKAKATKIAKIAAGIGLIFISPLHEENNNPVLKDKENNNPVLKDKESKLFAKMNRLYSNQIWEATNIMSNSLKFAMNGHYNMANSLLRNTLDLILSASAYNTLSHHILFTTISDKDDNKLFKSTFFHSMSNKTCHSCGKVTYEKDSTDTDKKSFMLGAHLEPRLKENFGPLFKHLLNEKELRRDFLDTDNLYHYLALSGEKCRNPDCFPELELDGLKQEYLYSIETMILAKQLRNYGLLKPFSSEYSLKNYIKYDELCRNVHERVVATDTARQMLARATESEEEDSEEESEKGTEYLPEKFNDYHERATKLMDVAAVILVNMINAWVEEIGKWKKDQEPEIHPDDDFIVIEKIYSKILEEFLTLRGYFKELGLKKTVKRIKQLSA